MKLLLVMLSFIIGNTLQAQRPVLTTDNSLTIPKVYFESNGALKITASPSSSPNDFDFLVGKWKMYHRRLNKRLENCKDWTEFESVDSNYQILSGKADMDIYYTTQMPGHVGEAFEGVTLRLYNPTNHLWSLYWVASNIGVLNPPVVGTFENNVGHFFTKDILNGKEIIVLFRWDVRDKEKPIWSQAFSPDNGKTWEWNWYNVSERLP
ncbi:MAG: hypothetical protein ABIN94_02795 [Ferruginibacter sp.]